MHFFHSIWKSLHLTENFYTGTACGACDKYEVWGDPPLSLYGKSATLTPKTFHPQMSKIAFLHKIDYHKNEFKLSSVLRLLFSSAFELYGGEDGVLHFLMSTNVS